VTLDVVGPWVDPMRGLRRRLEAEDHVRVHGPLDEDAKRAVLSGSRVLCVPSTEEALGGVHLEAWAARRPTVGADIAPVRELFDSTGGGLAVTPDAPGIAGALRRILGDPALAHQLADAGHQAVLARFNWSVAARQAAVAYEIAGGRTPGSPDPFA
jgi:glycosyltransferase involved in cell wall biosynthesis